MAEDLDELVRDFRERPLNEGPYTFVAADALTMKVREGGRVIKTGHLANFPPAEDRLPAFDSRSQRHGWQQQPRTFLNNELT
jgi:hypothetical protein